MDVSLRYEMQINETTISPCIGFLSPFYACKHLRTKSSCLRLKLGLHFQFHFPLLLPCLLVACPPSHSFSWLLDWSVNKRSVFIYLLLSAVLENVLSRCCDPTKIGKSCFGFMVCYFFRRYICVCYFCFVSMQNCELGLPVSMLGKRVSGTLLNIHLHCSSCIVRWKNFWLELRAKEG